MGEAWIVRNKQEAESFCQFVMENFNKGICYEIQRPTRTDRQNRGLHAYCREVAAQMEAQGLDMKTVIKDGVPILPTADMVKEYMWRPVQKAVLQIDSTTNLNRKQVDEVYQRLAPMLAQRYGINVPFGRE